MRRPLLAALVWVAASASAAAASPDGLTTQPTVIGIPTAWIQPGGALHVSGDGDHHAGSGIRATAGLGPLAEVDVASDDLLVRCDPCAGAERATTGLQQVSGGFKLGLWEDAWFRHQPALAVGVNAPITSRAGERAAEAYAVASLTVGPLRLHAGASAWSTEHRGADGARLHSGGLRAPRPLAAFEWTPEIYPRNTVSAEIQWVPELGPTAADTGPRWVIMWGMRYRAFAWGNIELGVKHRQGEDLGDAAIMVRVSARIGRGLSFGRL